MTTEVARHPADGAFEWRVSVATVEEDGPFSAFPGFDRVIVVLDGGRLRLTHAGMRPPVDLAPHQPHRFSGDWSTHGAPLDGPVRDFNVITARERWRASVTVASPAAPTMADCDGGVVLLYCASGSVVADGQTLGEGDGLLLHDRGSGGVMVQPRTAAPALLVVGLQPLGA